MEINENLNNVKDIGVTKLLKVFSNPNATIEDLDQLFTGELNLKFNSLYIFPLFSNIILNKCFGTMLPFDKVLYMLEHLFCTKMYDSKVDIVWNDFIKYSFDKHSMYISKNNTHEGDLQEVGLSKTQSKMHFIVCCFALQALMIIYYKHLPHNFPHIISINISDIKYNKSDITINMHNSNITKNIVNIDIPSNESSYPTFYPEKYKESLNNLLQEHTFNSEFDYFDFFITQTGEILNDYGFHELTLQLVNQKLNHYENEDRIKQVKENLKHLSEVLV